MQKSRQWIGKTLCTGGIGMLSIVSTARAGDYAFNTVIDNMTLVESGSPTLTTVYQVVTGNGGVVATISDFDDGSGDARYVTLNQSNGSAATQIIARQGTSGPLTLTGDAGSYHSSTAAEGFADFAELAISDSNGLRLTFAASDSTFPNPEKGLFQATVTGNSVSPSTIIYQSSYSLDTVPGVILSDVHAQVNASGSVAYQAVSGSNQAILSTSSTVDTSGKTNFNRTPTSDGTKRIALAEDGSVVFRATAGGLTSFYRSTMPSALEPAVAVPIITGLDENSRLVEASNDHVLYTTLSTTPNGTTETLYVAHDNQSESATALSSYDYSSLTDRRKAVMTQQNRVAYFDLGENQTPATTLRYFDANTGTKKTVAAVGEPSVAGSFTLNDFIDPTYEPMINDRGTVVYDATLTGADGDQYQAILAWDSQSQTSHIIVKVDLTNGSASDKYVVDGHEYEITGIVFPNTDVSGNNIGYGPLKDALSDDNWFAFGISYTTDGLDDHQAIVSVMIPEPSTAGLIIGVGATSLLRRRRR